MRTLLTMIGILSVFAGFIGMIAGLNIALWGSALGKRDALPCGLFIAFVGYLLFVIPILVEKMFS